MSVNKNVTVPAGRSVRTVVSYRLRGVQVGEITPGLWRWTARHPAWTPAEEGEWEPDVGCVYAEIDCRIVLIDPLVPAESERFWAALDRDVGRLGTPVVLTTTVDHARSSEKIIDRYGDGGLPSDGVTRIATALHGEVVFWLAPYRALVPGDVLLGDGTGRVRVCPDSWLEGADRTSVWASLRPLLGLPVERILVSHGEPVLTNGLAALERALRDQR